MTEIHLAHEASIDISATPETVYGMISDLPRMGEWSPENTGGRWLDGTPAQAGATFIGTNKMAGMGDMGAHEWESKCKVTVAEPGAHFEFEVGDTDDGGPYSRWKYLMQDNGAGGTKLTEAWNVLALPQGMDKMGDEMLQARQEMMVSGIETTLAAIKESAEA